MMYPRISEAVVRMEKAKDKICQTKRLIIRGGSINADSVDIQLQTFSNFRAISRDFIYRDNIEYDVHLSFY